MSDEQDDLRRKYYPGKRMTADGGRAEPSAAEPDPRRARIVKGAFLTSTPTAPSCILKRQQLPDDLKHFEAAVSQADAMLSFQERNAAFISEMARRLHAVRDGLDVIRKAKKK